MESNRLTGLVAVALIWAASALAADKGGPKEPVARGHAFLISLFDPELNLLPEFRGNKTYWLFHDNYLAARTLAKVKPELSRRIEASQ